MSISRRVAATLSALALTGGVSATALAIPASAAESSAAAGAVAAMTNPSDGFCNADEAGDVKLGGDNHLYECEFVTGLGWYWLPY